MEKRNLYKMNKEFVLKSWNLIKDAMNGNNGFIVKCAIDEFIVKCAIDELFHLIECDKMNTLEDYIAFKNEWYHQMKNK